jgi:hypothetical protein
MTIIRMPDESSIDVSMLKKPWSKKKKQPTRTRTCVGGDDDGDDRCAVASSDAVVVVVVVRFRVVRIRRVVAKPRGVDSKH